MVARLVRGRFKDGVVERLVRGRFKLVRGRSNVTELSLKCW